MDGRLFKDAPNNTLRILDLDTAVACPHTLMEGKSRDI